MDNTDYKKIFSSAKTLEEEKLYYFLAYQNEQNEEKKLLILKKLKDLEELMENEK